MPYVIPPIASVSRHRPNKYIKTCENQMRCSLYLGGVAQIIGYYETENVLRDT